MMRAPFVTVLLLAWALVPAQEPGLAITNVTVVDGTDAPERVATVIVEGDRIAGIRDAGDRPAGLRIIDGTGKYLVPALWDMHVHLAARPEPDLAERMMMPLLLAHGIVGVRDMGGPLARVVDLRSRVGRQELAGPRILTPGPFVDGAGEADPMFRRAPDAASAATIVGELAASGVDFIKAQAGLQPAAHRALASAARDAGLTLAGHIPTSMSVEEVVQNGQRTIEHVSPALVGDGMLLMACSSRPHELLAELRAIETARGSLPAEEIARREAVLRQRTVDTYDPERALTLGRLLRDRGVWIVPTLIWSASFRPQTREDDGRGLAMEYVPAAMRTRFVQARRQFIARQSDEALAAARAVAVASARAVRDLHAAGARILAGTDTFDAFVLPGVSLHQELQLLVEAGISPRAALQAATRNAAEARGTQDVEGTVAAGKRADLLLVDADPTLNIGNLARVSAVVSGGRLYDRATLDRLLAEARAFAAQ